MPYCRSMSEKTLQTIRLSPRSMARRLPNGQAARVWSVRYRPLTTGSLETDEMSVAMNILVVEPHRQDAADLVACSAVIGAETRVATSVAEAMDLLRTEVFEAALVAAELGVEAGSLLDRLVRLPSPRVVLATGPIGDTALRLRIHRAGANAFLVRPVDAKSLAMALAHAGGRTMAHGLYVDILPVKTGPNGSFLWRLAHGQDAHATSSATTQPAPPPRAGPDCPARAPRRRRTIRGARPDGDHRPSAVVPPPCQDRPRGAGRTRRR